MSFGPKHLCTTCGYGSDAWDEFSAHMRVEHPADRFTVVEMARATEPGVVRGFPEPERDPIDEAHYDKGGKVIRGVNAPDKMPIIDREEPPGPAPDDPRWQP